MPINEENFNQALDLLKQQGESEEDIFGELEGLPDNEIDVFSKSILKELQQVQGIERTGGVAQSTEAFGRGLLETVSFGQAEKVGALIDAGIGETFELLGLAEPQTFVQRLESAQAEQDVLSEKLKRENIIASTGGEIAGFFLPFGGGKLAVTAGRKIAGTIGKGGLRRTAARVGAEGAVTAGAFAAGREGAEVVTGEQDLAGAAVQVGFETVIGGVAGGAITSLGVGASAFAKGARNIAAPFVKRIVNKAKDTLPENMTAILDNLPKAGNILARGLGKTAKETGEGVEKKLGGLLEELDTVKKSLQSQLDETAGDLMPDAIVLKAQLDDTIDRVTQTVIDGLEQQKLPADVLEDNISALAYIFNRARRGLDVSYGQNLEKIVQVHKSKGTTIDLSSAMDDLLLAFENSGVLQKGKIIDEAIPKTFKPSQRKFIKEHITAILQNRKTVSFEQANEVKKLVGSIADFSRADDLGTVAYDKIRKLITVADDGVTNSFDELSQSYTQGRKLADSLRRQTRDTDVTTTLFNKIAKDLEQPFQGTPTVGKVQKLLELKKFDVFTKEEQQIIKGTFNQVRRNTEIERLANPKQLQATFKKLSKNVNAKQTDADLAKLEAFLGQIDEVKQMQNLGDQLNLPKVIRNVLKNPSDKKAIAQATELVTKTSKESLPEFNKMVARAAKLERLKGLPSGKNSVLNAVREQGQISDDIIRELELSADFIPEFKELLDEQKLIKLIQNPEVLKELARVRQLGQLLAGGGSSLALLDASDAVPFLEAIPKPLKIAMGLFALRQLANNPTGLALALERANIVGSRKAAERIANAIAPKAQFIRQSLAAITNVATPEQ